MFYTLTPTFSGSTLTFSDSFQPGDVIQFTAPMSNVTGSASYTAMNSSGVSYPMTYAGSETFPAYFFYTNQVYVMVFTGTYYEVTAQQAVNSSGVSLNTEPFVVNNFLDPSANGLLANQMADVQQTVADLQQSNTFISPVTMTQGLAVTGTVSIDGTLAATANNSLELGGIPAADWAPLASPTFTGTPSAPAFTLTESVSLSGTSGEVQYTMPFQGTYKKVVVSALSYQNTGSVQSINFPTPFSSYEAVTLNTTGLTLSSTSSALTLTTSGSTVYSGLIIVEGM